MKFSESSTTCRPTLFILAYLFNLLAAHCATNDPLQQDRVSQIRPLVTTNPSKCTGICSPDTNDPLKTSIDIENMKENEVNQYLLNSYVSQLDHLTIDLPVTDLPPPQPDVQPKPLAFKYKEAAISVIVTLLSMGGTVSGYIFLHLLSKINWGLNNDTTKVRIVKLTISFLFHLQIYGAYVLSATKLRSFEVFWLSTLYVLFFIVPYEREVRRMYRRREEIDRNSITNVPSQLGGSNVEMNQNLMPKVDPITEMNQNLMPKLEPISDEEIIKARNV